MSDTIRWSTRDAVHTGASDPRSRWTHVKSMPSTMLEEQWIFRFEGRVPAISLKKETAQHKLTARQLWTASLLMLGGISAQSFSVSEPCFLEEAQAQAVIKLQQMGWEVSDG